MMRDKLNLNAIEAIVVHQALQDFHKRAEIEATEYEVKEAKEERIYGVPLIHPRVIANTCKNLIEELTAEYEG